jgi:arylsulfatase A-like enzyme
MTAYHMVLLLRLLTVQTVLLCCSLSFLQAQHQSPNIVFIIADQMRGDALGSLGHPNVHTPNLDAMAAEGVLFKNFFVNNPVCAPSRMSFFTSLYPHQHGKITNTDGELIQSLDQSMFGYFKERGYRIGWFGKNHHSHAKPLMAELDTVKGRNKEPFRSYNKFVPPHWHSDFPWPKEDTYAPMTTQDGINFIQEAKADEPFFLYLSYLDPHPPYMAPAEYTSKYCSDDIELPPFIPPSNLSPRLEEEYRLRRFDKLTEADLKETMRYYYAAIEWGVDYQIGQVLQALRDQGMMDNTIVVFSSDHGDFMGEYHMVRKGMFLYDALLHVPFIWYAPGIISQGIQSEVMTQSVDLYPTLVELTGGKIPEGLFGRSLKPFLTGQTEDEEDFAVYAFTAYNDLPKNYFDHPVPYYNPDSDEPFHYRVQHLTWEGKHQTAMIRTKDWKLILSETRPLELYHMNGSWTEKENIANNPDYANIITSLKIKLEKAGALAR